jgi:hypothetical protein
MAAEPRSRLLREAVPAKPSDPRPQEPPEPDEAAKIANANGQGKEVRSAGEQESGISQSAEPLPSPPAPQAADPDGTPGLGVPQAGQSGTSSRSTLLDRLRGVAEESVEADK